MKKESELISLIIPVYNVEQYLNKCIESVINQTYLNIEILLIDDGSTDNSGKICDEYKLKDDRVKVIHKKNGGLSDARNIGIENATGKYITFVDSDDWLNLDYCDVMHKKIVNEKCDIVMCDLQKVYNDTEEFETNMNYIEKEYSNIEALEKLEDTIYVVAVAKLYNANLFSKLRYIKGKVHEDEFIFHKLFYESKNVIHINQKLYAYRQRDNSITNSKYSLKRLNGIEALEDRINFYKLQKLKRLEDKTTALYMYMLKVNIIKLNLSDIDNKTAMIDELFDKLIKCYKFCRKTEFVSMKFYISCKTYTIFPHLFKAYLLRNKTSI